MILNITSKNNDPQELEIVNIVNGLCEQYDIPAFTQTVLVEKDSIPHSHPILTLNTRVKDSRLLLKTLVHEQLHWYAKNHPQYKNCIAYLKTRYRDDGEHNKLGTYPDSYWEHIIICFNALNYLENFLSKEDVEWIYQQWQAYPTLEKLVVQNKEKVRTDLAKFELILIK